VTLRAVVDPNVFISAQISSLGHPARIAQAADKGIFELVVSERLLSELHDVLMRPRFRRHMTEREVENLAEDLRENSIIAEEGETGRMVPDDPKDHYLVALARVSGADYLVSGDPHLTASSLDPATVTVLTPRRFGEMLEEPDR
jgi:putative PIN family toxin of toxin-antitoxin system